jgi:glycosyltransferase involved in cell wall biosynthesis
MSTGVKLSVVLPAFKEEKTIALALSRLNACLKEAQINYEIILVVDGDIDNTAAIAQSLNIKELRTLVIKQNQGKGAAIRLGILSSNATDFIGYMDADLDIEPEGLLTGLRTLKRDNLVDLVVGSKLHPDSFVSYPVFRKIQSQIFRLLVNLLFKLEISDTQTGLKIGKAKIIREAVPSDRVDGFAFDLALLVNAHKKGRTLAEVPIRINYQFESSVRLRSALKTLVDTINLYRSFKFDQRNEK